MPQNLSALPPASIQPNAPTRSPEQAAALPVPLAEALQALPQELKQPAATDALIKHSVVQLARRGTAHVKSVPVNGGDYDLRFPGCDYRIDLSVPHGNAFNPVQISAGAKPTLPPPASVTQQAWRWTKSFFVTPPPLPPTLQAAENETPYLRPFRWTLAKPTTARVANLTGWAWMDRWLHKFVKIDCTGVKVDAGGKLQLDGALRLGIFQLPVLDYIVPLHKLFLVNMSLDGIMDEPLLTVGAGTGKSSADEALATQDYVFDWLSRMLGTVHADMRRPGTLEIYNGVRYTPKKVAHDVHFTPAGVRMKLATRGELDVGGQKIAASVSMPMTIDLDRGAQAPMHVEIGASQLSLRGDDGGAGRWWFKGSFGYDDGLGKTVDAAEPLARNDAVEA